MSRPRKIAPYHDPKPRIDELKRELCHLIQRACMRNQWNQVMAAHCLRTSRSCIHQVDNYKIDQLTVNQLFRYLATAAPQFRVMISIYPY